MMVGNEKKNLEIVSEEKDGIGVIIDRNLSHCILYLSEYADSKQNDTIIK